MKVVFYYFMGGGGGLANIVLLLRAMARRHPEDTIEVVTSPATPLAALQDEPNIRVRRLRATGFQEIDRLLAGCFLLNRLLRETKADIVWSLNVGPYRKTGIPAVLSVHNPHQVYPWEVARHHPGKPWDVALLRWFFRRSLRISDAVIVQTEIMGEYVRRIPGSPRRWCVAPKAVEREGDVRTEALPQSLQAAFEGGLGCDAFTFLYASTWSPHKNHVTLLEAFSELAKRNIRARAVLTVEPGEILSAGWRETASLIAAGYIVPVGWVAKPHLRALYGKCDACLMPSVLESLSSAHIEAMRWGRPQIAADLPYARDLCGTAALYAGAEDAQSWVGQIERIIGDRSVRDELIRAGYARMTCFPVSWDEAAEAVHAFLASVRREFH